MSRALCWIRRDLRLSDHRALFEACSNHDEVAVVFVFDTVILDQLENKSDRRVTFIMQSLAEVDAGLREQGSSLIVLCGDPAQVIPPLAAQLEVQAVITARDFEPYALERDHKVQSVLSNQGIDFQTVKDQVIFENGEVLSKTEAPFRIFTPFSRRWLELFDRQVDAQEYVPDLTKLMPTDNHRHLSIGLDYAAIGFYQNEPWLPAGERAGNKALRTFECKIDQYGEARDIPSMDGTSFLSVHLRFGTVSVRESVRTAIQHDSPGAKKWLTELIWREFYQDILANNPRVVSTTFDPVYRDMVWPGLDEHFIAWKQGQTGYPIIDAAMRCFAETGWMHNRLRMIVASFLTKDLLVDYRKGEAYFAAHLLDFDLASNNGGWQWAASVGCDAQPYFRIFNPSLQSQKFDTEGKFIREWVPELADLDSRSIHQPSEMEALMGGYPAPIVDHYVQRKLALDLFGEARKSPEQTFDRGFFG